jgi:hypothetical protein
MRVLAGSFALLCTACAVRSSSPTNPQPSSLDSTPAAPPASPPARARPEPPRDIDFVPTLAIDVEGPPRVSAGQTITLLIRVHNRLTPPMPLRLSITLPRGVRLVEGATQEILAQPAPLSERRLKLALDAIPADDLVVDVALADAPSQHVTSAYRFGRAAPPPPPPIPNDPDTTIRKPYLERRTIPPGPPGSPAPP